jgi:Cu(I)/Ag(I) efflux system protein CusF
MRNAHVHHIAAAVAAALTFGLGSGAAKAESAPAPVRLAQAQKAVGEATGTIKAVDADERQLLITHGPITGGVQMPGMTMAFRVAPNVELSGLKAGAKVKFSVARDEKGLYVIEDIHLE